METPNKIKCPHCGSENCFEETQAVENELVKSYLCIGCGYTSTTLNKEGSTMISEYEEITAELIKALRWVDTKTNLVWYPIVLNFPSFGIIFPDGETKSNWEWMAAPAVEISKEEQKKYPIPGQTDAYYTKRIDMNLGKKFNSDAFKEACEFIGFIQS